MPLKLSLKPGETIVVNGAVLRNGGSRRSELMLENQARVLREKDILDPETILEKSPEAYPVTHLYFKAQSAYLLGDLQKDWSAAATDLFMHARKKYPEHEGAITSIENNMREKDYYKALSGLRKLNNEVKEIDMDAGREDPAIVAKSALRRCALA